MLGQDFLEKTFLGYAGNVKFHMSTKMLSTEYSFYFLLWNDASNVVQRISHKTLFDDAYAWK